MKPHLSPEACCALIPVHQRLRLGFGQLRYFIVAVSDAFEMGQQGLQRDRRRQTENGFPMFQFFVEFFSVFGNLCVMLLDLLIQPLACQYPVPQSVALLQQLLSFSVSVGTQTMQQRNQLSWLEIGVAGRTRNLIDAITNHIQVF